MNCFKFLLTVLIGTSVVALRGAVNLPNPIAWWKMDAIVDSKVEDASGNGHDLTVGSGCVVTNESLTGSAVFWNGTSQAWGRYFYPELRSSTISIWFRRDRLDSQADGGPYLFCANAYKVHMNLDPSSVDAGTGVYLPDGKWKQPTFTVARDAWSHLVLVIEEKSFAEGKCTFAYRGYLNGNLIVSDDTGRSFVPYSLSNAILGNNAQAGSRPVNGIFDDVRIFDQALTQGQVLQLYDEGCNLAGNVRLIGRWNLDDVQTDDLGNRTVPELTGFFSPLSLEAGAALTNGVEAGMKALWFDGTSQTLCSATSRYLFSPGEVSFATWIYHAPEASTPVIEGNLYNTFVGIGSIFYMQLIAGDINTLGMYYGPSGKSVMSTGFSSGYGVWDHVVVCCKTWYDDAEGTYKSFPVFYRDGALVATGAVANVTSRSALFSGTQCLFGGNGVRNRVFHGAMCDMRLYAGMLTPEQVRQLYCGAAQPDAGADFTVAGPTARLLGRVADTASPSGGMRHGFAGRSRWSLVESPADGAVAEITNPEAESTDVTLPAAGAYVFRLTVTTDEGDSRSDDVVVTRVGPQGLAAPSVSIVAAEGKASPEAVTLTATASDPAGKPLRLVWRRVSGPGTVRFSSPDAAKTEALFSQAGSYVVSCTAENGETSAEARVSVDVAEATIAVPSFLGQGLRCFWDFDHTIPWRDVVSSTDGEFNPDSRQCRLEPGVSGNGIASRESVSGLFNTKVRLPETGTDGQVPTSRWLTFSLWMYHDPGEDVSKTMEASLVFVPYSLGIRYNCEGGGDGFTLYHQGLYGGVSKMKFARPAVDPKGRWTHVVAVLDRATAAESNASQLWIDGVLQVPTNGVLNAARKQPYTVYLGGMGASATHDEYNGSYVIGGVTYSRRFPGVIDEVRVYDRALSEAEIKWLAAHPQVDGVTGPVVDGLPDTVVETKKERFTLSPVVSGADEPGAVCQWTVVSGDASGLLIQDADQPTCTVDAVKAGTYRMRLSVTSGVRTTQSDVVTVIIRKRGSVITIR